MSEEGHWIEREPDEVPERAKPKKVRREKAVLVIQQDYTPQSPDAERGVISSMLAKPMEIIPDFREKGSLDWFYNDPLRELVGEMFSCLDSKGALDIVILSQWLIDRGMMDKIGGPFTLAELQSFVPTPEHYPYYCGILSDKAKLRAVNSKCEAIKVAVKSSGDDMQEISRAVTEYSSSMISLFHEKDSKESMENAFQLWEKNWHDKAAGKMKSAMPSRWSCLNNSIGGIRPGYTIISGEYSSGKSVLVANILADACIKEDRPGILFSFETPVQDVISRIVCDIGGIMGQYVFLPDRFPPPPAVVKGIAQAMAKIMQSNLEIIHKPYLSAEQICYICRKKKDKKGDLIVGVDYLQKLPAPRNIEKGATNERELAVNSDTLQKLSKELEVPMLVLCQNNKDGSSRGSVAIEMDCDECLRIEGDMGVFVKKNRNGAREFHLPLFLEKGMFRFQEKELDSSFP